MQGLLEARLLSLLVLIGTCAHASDNMDRGKETFLIRYKNGEGIVPVSVRLDYTQGTEYVLSLSPQSDEKAVTFYDFNMRMIAFKHLASRNCFIMRMKHENINKEQRTLDSFKNEVISGTRPVIFYASGEPLSQASLKKLAGPKVARFCHRTKAYLIVSQKHKRRPKREADDYTQRSYGHFGQQSQSYSHYGQDTVTNGRGPAPPVAPFNSRGIPPLNSADTRTASIPGNIPGGSYSFQGNQRSGYELYQPLGPNGGLRTYGEYGTGFGQIPGFSGDPKQLAEQIALQSGVQPFSSQEQVLRFPLPPSQNGEDRLRQDSRTQDPRLQNLRVQDTSTQDRPAQDYRAQNPRLQDPRARDPRIQDPRSQISSNQDPRVQDPRYRDPRDPNVGSQDARAYDPRYRAATTDARLSGPYPPQSSSQPPRSHSTPAYDPARSHPRGAATDSESGAYAGGLSRDLQVPLSFRNMTLPFNSFDTDTTLSGTGVLSNTKVTVDNTGTNAVASSTGQLNDQRSQSQVQGTYVGAGSFSAQAQAGFLHGTTQSQVRGGSDGGSSISSANVERLGSAQSQVQVGTPDGKSSGSAQGNFVRGGTQAEAQGSRDAGTASAQAQSPGLSQSSAAVNARGTGSPRHRFLGDVSASTRGDLSSGVSSTNLQGSYGSDNTYSARSEGSFNSQSSYSPFSGLPPSASFDDRTDTSRGSRRGDVLPEYRYQTTTRSPYDLQRNQTFPEYRYPTTRSPYEEHDRNRYITTPPTYDSRVHPDYRYTSTTTQSPYVYPSRDRTDPRRSGSLPGEQDVRRSGVSPYDGTHYFPPSLTTTTTREPQRRGETQHPDPYQQRRLNIFPPYSPDPRLANKGPPGPPPNPYDSRRAYVAPSQTKSEISHPAPRAYVFPDPSRHPTPSQTKSQVSYPSPSRAYVFPDQQSASQTKSQISYPAQPPRAYVFPDQQPASQTKSHPSYPSRAPVYTNPSNSGQQGSTPPKQQMSCCRARRGQLQSCCQLVPTAECCPGYQRDEQTRSRRYLNDENNRQDSKCNSPCYTVYKTIGQAKICQPNSSGNC